MNEIKTYQDLLAIGEDETRRMDFVKTCINEHKSTPGYQMAVVAEEYDRRRNVTIMQYQKLLYTITGKAVPDNYSANYKLRSNFFDRFVVQEVQYLMGNGVTWENTDTDDKLGNDFDTQLQEAGKAALVGGVSFGFFNLDHIDVFKLTEFAPLYDEENGALMAGVRFWQIDATKPLRATLYELDGYTDYLWKDGKGELLQDKNGNVIGKRAYVITVTGDEKDREDNTVIYDGQNYPSFPIIPYYGNPHKQSELEGLREQIDCYDLIKSGFANTVDEASYVYWTIQNAGGMDDVDLAEFVERMKTIHAARAGGENGYEAKAEAHTVEVPYASREALLSRLERDLYKDAMALNTQDIASGAVTATQILAAYEPLNSKTDQFEYCTIQFIQGILGVAGIEDNPTFTRSKIVNVSEEMQVLVAAAAFLGDEYVTQKALELLGDGDRAEEILKRIDIDAMDRFGGDDDGTDNP